MAFDDSVAGGSTSKIVEVTLRDSTTGGGKTGIAYGSVTASYVREGGTRTAITLASGAAGDSYSSGKWAEVDSTNCKGLYQLHIPNAAIAAGVEAVTITLQATGVIDKHVRIKLRATNVQDAVRGGMSALPNAAADAAGGLPISDAGGLDLDTFLGRITANVATSAALATAQADLDIITGTAGVLIDTGTGAGQLQISSGVVQSNVMQISSQSVSMTLVNGSFKLDVNAYGVGGSFDAAMNAAVVFDTDFSTAYNTTRNAWTLNAQDFVGTSGSDPFNGQVVAASVAGGINTSAGTITTLDGLDTAQDSQHSTTQSRLPAALISGRMASDIEAVNDDTTAASNLRLSSLAVRGGAVQTAESSANTNTVFDTNLPLENDDYYGDADGGLVIAFISGTAQQFQTRRIVASSTGSSNTRITLESALDGTPADSDEFVVLGRITELV